ncbi:hypothetical protein HOY80DRAFT_989468 [Tuber brumale]|nr:hypothetical protein HOY80DRAFT_989468 [Tuber brumale]
MPSAGRSLPTTRPKSWRLQRPHDKGNIAKGDQEKYQHKLLKAVQNFVIGGNQPNLDIIAISFEHKCFSEARNRAEYISAINAKLREWNYDDISDDDTAPSSSPQPSIKKQKTISPSPPLPTASANTIRSNTTTSAATNTTSSSSPSQPSSPPLPLPLLPMEMTKTMTTHLPTPPQGKIQGGGGGGGGGFVQLFDPKVLDKIDLNDPVKRTEWVRAVWEYFSSGGRWNPGRWDQDREEGDESMGDGWDRDGGWA